MVKIADALQELNLSKDQFLDLYKKTFWEDAPKNWIIKKEALVSMQQKTSQSATQSPAKRVVRKVIKKSSDVSWTSDAKDSWSTTKVVSAKKFGSWNSFFSGLWFEKKQEEIQVEELQQEEKKDDFFAQATSIAKNRPVGNAKVVRRSEPVRRPVWWSRPHWTSQWTTQNRTTQNTSQWWAPFTRQSQQSQSAPRPRTWPAPMRWDAVHNRAWRTSGPAKWNVAIGQWTYRPSTKPRYDRGASSYQQSNQPQLQANTWLSEKVKKQKVAKTSGTLQKKAEVVIWKVITVKELSEKMGIQMNDLMKVMLQNKIIWWVNKALDFDTASLLAEEFNIKVVKEHEQVAIENVLTWDLQSILDQDKQSDGLISRPPVITVMWHVDHGKTSLLDYLRKSNIAWWEAWWITQSIGASMIEYKWKKMTFIDTPWHELFTSLRARWAKLTNIVIIIVAADDGIKPQTIESISHAKESGVPIIVAVTKIDKPNNNFEKIKTDIWLYGLIPEEWGGDVAVVGVSSKTGEWIDDLLENIALQAEILDLKYNPHRKAVGVVVDASKDPKEWITASVIILTGTLKIWDVIVAHNTFWKVKRMINSHKKTIKTATWWEPVMILWLQDIPEPWRIVEVVDKEKDAQQRISLIQWELQEEIKHSSLQRFMEQRNMAEGTAVLKVIIKADWPSSLEALQSAIGQITLPEKVDIKIIHAWIGLFTDSDISLWQASDALLVWFNANIPAAIKKKADQMHLTLKNWAIIYELIAYIEDVLLWLVEIEMEEVNMWRLKVLWVFFKKEKMMVIWWKVIEWKAKNGSKFRIWRDDEELAEWTVTSLQREQESVSSVATGYECWMKVKTWKRIEEWDILEFFEMAEKK